MIKVAGGLVAALWLVSSGWPPSGADGLQKGDQKSDIAVAFAAVRERCFECHDVDESKGGLRLDQLEGWTGNVDTESPEDSEFLYRVLLPRDDGDAMPPEGEALAPAAIQALQRWIEAGASTAELEKALAKAREGEQRASADIDAVRKATGARIVPVTSDLTAPAAAQRFDVSWRHVDQVPDRARLAALAPIAPRIVELDLAGRALESGALAALPKLPALDRVHLERTRVTDASVAMLCERAPALRYVNLHSTAVTSAVLGEFSALPGLERVVLFGTAVTESDVDTFRAMRPGVKVTLDAGFPASARFSQRQHRRILAADASKGRVALLREVALGRPEVLWEHPITASHDLQWLGDTEDGHGRVLIQESWTRIIEVDTRTDEVLWSYEAAADGTVEIHSFRRLADGTTMIAESGARRIVFVDGGGRVTHTIALTVNTPDAHHDTRLVRPTRAGTFLVAHENDGVVREYDRSGNVVWTFEVPLFGRERVAGNGAGAHGNQVFAAVRLANGETLITTGNGSSLLIVAPDGAIRRRVSTNDVDGLNLAWVTTVQELANGNVVLTSCHGDPAQAQAIEITPENEIVWSFRDVEHFGSGLSNLVVIEAER